MEIIIGKNVGFCFGVKRAVDNTLNETIKNSNKTFCLGELVHNYNVMQKIKDNGITIVDDIDDIKEENVNLIIRAHGVNKKIYDIAKKRNMNVFDFTCPFVTKIHKYAEEYQEKGYYIFLIGNKNHPEIIGTVSHCGNNYLVIEDIETLKIEFDKLKKKKNPNLLVIVQTTYNENKFEMMEKYIKEHNDTKMNIVIKNTICKATIQRQEETKEIAKKVDIMIIIGGKNSSNTKKLFEIASEYTNSILIENIEELDIPKIKGYNKIGIMSGASTSWENIYDIISKIKK